MTDRNAEWLVQFLVDFNAVNAAEFNARYPDFIADRDEAQRQGYRGWEAALRVVLDYAREINVASKESTPPLFGEER